LLALKVLARLPSCASCLTLDISPTRARVAVDAGTRARVAVDAGTRARVAVDAGMRACIAVDAGTRARVAVDAGTRARVAVDAGTRACEHRRAHRRHRHARPMHSPCNAFGVTVDACALVRCHGPRLHACLASRLTRARSFGVAVDARALAWRRGTHLPLPSRPWG
jgi:hypothetical protein